jgi:hypothetical protein
MKDRKCNGQKKKDERQTTQLSKEKGQTFLSTKHYTEDYIVSNTNSTKNRGELRCSGMINRSCSTGDTRHVTMLQIIRKVAWRNKMYSLNIIINYYIDIDEIP